MQNIAEIVGDVPWLAVLVLAAMIVTGIAILVKQYRQNRDD